MLHTNYGLLYGYGGRNHYSVSRSVTQAPRNKYLGSFFRILSICHPVKIKGSTPTPLGLGRGQGGFHGLAEPTPKGTKHQGSLQ